MDESDERIAKIVDFLTDCFGRLPTEDEVLAFINGDEEARHKLIRDVWAKLEC